MSLCPDEGGLLYGPESSDEPATAILHETASQNEEATRAQRLKTDPFMAPLRDAMLKRRNLLALARS